MKLMHLSDLHLGKRVNEYSMLEDQRYILQILLQIMDAEQPDAVLLAGDIYDKSIPSAEAVALCDEFLCSLSRRQLPVFVISGNHDSPERLSFGSRLMDASGVHLSPVYSGHICPAILTDSFGEVCIWMLPYLRPIHIRRFWPEAEIESFTDALSAVISHLPIDPTRRNVLLTHQFVTGARRSDSEEISVGGTDAVDASVFAPFDYVALGHLHMSQNIGSPSIRYCGAPLKYAVSEAGQEKSVTIVELSEKGSLSVREIPLMPLRELTELRGSFAAILNAAAAGTVCTEDYLHITLTDEMDIPEAMGRLRQIYPYLLQLDYDNRRTRAQSFSEMPTAQETASPVALFARFYEQQNSHPMSAQQLQWTQELMHDIWEERQ